jgi:cytochrome c peroxidase
MRKKSNGRVRWLLRALSCGGAAVLSSCGGGSSPDTGAAPALPPTQSPASVAGKAIFFDKSLSVSGRQSCATCHVPSRAFTADPAPNHGLPVALGGPNMDQTGFRNAPSLMYASFTPPFSLADGPVGGFFRDGRASSLATQAM